MSILDVFRAPPTAVPPPVDPGQLVLSSEGIWVELGGHDVLQDVSLPVVAGEVLALVGPNGAGKSTLLAALAGDAALRKGQIRLFGEPLHHWRAQELALRRAVLMQQVQLSFPFNVLDVVQMGRAPWSNTTESVFDDELVSAAMLATDVTGFASRKFSNLSGGEKARVALARVLAQNTGVLMLDEPTAALDLRHQELVLQVARTRAATGRAVVVVLHDLNLAAGYADKVAVLEKGRLAAHGTAKDVLTEELLSRVYQYGIDVMAHPVTGRTVVLPQR
ncbi:heme ABC transporter ATP-binding protein [Arthrobacter sp.]|uniref:heme ABC transporter ATP-binding protein n=1 Tax=Arthrobacter sp. TaxID=1667 RepID=UPI0026E05548|nr:heme ABC transporter ATP-binding protein [Arthrobacter sp.]MDO5754236.1 heme ABC transporter ATP-binding protein [Arthrobacter sp.]